jgi:hypothetical protein
MSDDVAPTEAGRRWYQFSILQIMESTFWVALGVMNIIGCSKMTGGMWNTILVIAWLLPGAPFGIAVGALIGERQVCAAIGMILWFLFLCALATAKWLLF